MIIRKNLKWSIILKHTGQELAIFSAFSFLVFIFVCYFDWKFIQIPFGTMSLFSTALGIFLAFRANQAYDRWWEARRIWGTLTNSSRIFGRQLLTYFQNSNQSQLTSIIYRHLAFVNALKIQLRQLDTWDDLKPYLSNQEFEKILTADNKPNMIQFLQGQKLVDLKKDLDPIVFIEIEKQLNEFTNVQGMCERIKNTPFPRQFHFFPNLFTWIHGLLLPLTLVNDASFWVVPITTLVTFIFTTMNKVSARLEDPFENTLSDIPLSAISKTIEINLKEMLGESPLPEKEPVVDGFLM